MFSEKAAETLYVCSRSLIGEGETTFGRAQIVGISEYRQRPGTVDVAELMRLLRTRGCTRVFVEGGGVTVSMFLEAGLLDRLHLAVAPLLIPGAGRRGLFNPPVTVPTEAALSDQLVAFLGRHPGTAASRLGYGPPTARSGQ